MHGKNCVTLKVKTLALASDVRKVTDKIGALLAKSLTSRPGSEPTLRRVLS